MSRILANIILVLIIAFTVSAVPINTEILNLNITLPDTSSSESETDTDTQQEQYLGLSYETQAFDYLYNPQKIELKFTAKSQDNNPSSESTDSSADASQAVSIDKTLVNDFIRGIQLEIYRPSEEEADSIVKRLSDSDISEFILAETDQNTLTLTLDISSTSQNLGNGHYALRVSSESPHLSTPFEANMDASYFNEVTYKSPQANPKSGYRLMTLFFMDEGKNFLVPVSREIRDNGKVIRTTLNALRDGPSEESGLSAKSPAPYVPVARFSSASETVTLETNSLQNKDFTQTEEDTYLMMHSLINTMTHIENVSKVKFSVDKKDREPLNGFDLSKAYTRPEAPFAYLSLQVENNRAYLTPIHVDASTAKDMLHYLKYGVEETDKLFLPTIPNIEVVSENLTDGVLSVTLSDEVLDAYPESPVYGQIMMDSLVLSLGSLEGAQELILTTESRTEGELHGYTLGESFKPARYPNME